jgi:hypothetical protein
MAWQQRRPRGRVGAEVGSLDGRGSMAAWISRRLARSRVERRDGKAEGGWRGEHHDAWSGEVIGHRNGGVVEQTSCLLDRSAAQAQEDSVRSSGRPTGSIIE